MGEAGHNEKGKPIIADTLEAALCPILGGSHVPSDHLTAV